MNKKDLVNSVFAFAERSEWTFLDEKLYFLEHLSNDEILDETVQKIYSLKSIPKETKNLCFFVGDYIKNPPSKMSDKDRYLLSVFLAYESSDDMKKKI